MPDAEDSVESVSDPMPVHNRSCTKRKQISGQLLSIPGDSNSGDVSGRISC